MKVETEIFSYLCYGGTVATEYNTVLKMTVEEALKLIVKNKGISSLNYAIGYAEFALQLIFHGEHNTQGFKTQLLYVLNNMTKWRQSKLSGTTAAKIKECRAVLKKASV